MIATPATPPATPPATMNANPMNSATRGNHRSPVCCRLGRVAGTAALAMLLAIAAQARTWTSADGAKTFEGELKSYDPTSGAVGVTQPNGVVIKFTQDKLSAADIAFLKEQGPVGGSAPNKSAGSKYNLDPAKYLQKYDGKPADMTKPVQAFIMMGQSNMVGMAMVGPESKENSLEWFCKKDKKYPYLVDDAGKWVVRNDVRCAMVTCNQHCDWLQPGFGGGSGRMGVELGFGQVIGNLIDAPVFLVKACIGNRSLGWDLLPPGSEPYQAGGKTIPGYRGTPENPKGNGQKVTGAWYAGKQYDDDTDNAKAALADIGKNYPGATKYEVAGFVFWQGEKDLGSAENAAHYEQNLVRFIKQLRKDFNAPNAKFVLATLGEAAKGCGGNEGKILEAHLAVDGASGKYPEFKGNVATVYSNPLSNGGSGNGHYNLNAGTYMNVGEAMGKAMAELLGNQKK